MINMPHMRKLAWAKLKSPFSKPETGNECGTSNLSSKLNVNEEYKEAFRTKSYVEMWSNIQGQLRRKSIDGVDRFSSSSSLPFYIHLSDYLFEPEQQENLTEMIEKMKFHRLLNEYLEANLDACSLCDSLLRSIYQTRVNYRRIENVIKLSKRVKDSRDYSDSKVNGALLKDLSAFALLRNPLSLSSSVQFGDVHGNNLVLLQRLSSEHRKIGRKVKFSRICKKIGGYSLVIVHTAILVGLLVIALHGIIGVVAAPGLMGSSFYFLRKKIKLINGGLKTSLLEKLCAQLDLAAKGTYILMNDFDTVSRLVRSLYNEIEHKKSLAELCIRSKNVDLLKEVVKEFYLQDSYYQQQLDELEEHVYLCFHTINRSRRLVIQEIMMVHNKNVNID
ncbi:UPF0496 protein At1g20180 [Mercurialis annua]|uniref:UPF0496 protein At1g20180 n=1 Tax=Mercurialis annua TaxID=3986 RepID=UPI00215F9C53|nr:UPF0496 protein At1g20180 [Mercurialis annua]